MGSGSSVPFEDDDGVAIQPIETPSRGWASLQGAIRDRSYGQSGDGPSGSTYDQESKSRPGSSESLRGRSTSPRASHDRLSSSVSPGRKASTIAKFLGGGGVSPVPSLAGGSKVSSSVDFVESPNSPMARPKGRTRRASMVNALNSMIPVLKAKKAEEELVQSQHVEQEAPPLPPPPPRNTPWPGRLAETESMEKQAYFELHQIHTVIGSWWKEVSTSQSEDPWDELYKRIKPRMKKIDVDVVVEAERLFVDSDLLDESSVRDESGGGGGGKTDGKPAYESKVLKGLMGTVDGVDQMSEQLQAKALFADMDMDHSQELNKDELAQALRSKGIKMSNKEIDKLFAKMDVNGDNKVSVEEFMFVMNIPTDNVRVELERWLTFTGVLTALMRRLPRRLSPDSGPLDGVKSLTETKAAKACFKGLADELSELVVVGARALRDAEDKAKSALQSNSKYATSNEVFAGSFGTISHYSEGLDAHVGLPNAKVWETMRKEHCTSMDSLDTFETSNYGGTQAKPVQEWEIVVKPVITRVYPGQRHVRELDIFLKVAQVDGMKIENEQEKDTARMLLVRTALSQFAADANGKRKKALETVMNSSTTSSFADVCAALKEWVSKDELTTMVDIRIKHLQQANLCREEIVALRLYTGPMYMKYNTVLRGFPKQAIRALKGNRYTTTIHAVVSGLLKLQAVTVVPSGHKVYRGMSGMRLPDQFWNKDEFGCRGGVEFGLLSTTTKREVAMQYAGDGAQPMIFEISVGQVDRGASLSWISQYADEEEILFPPLSNLEVTGDPKMENVDGVVATVIPIRINANTRCLTLDELKSRRKTLHLDMFENILDEIERDLIEKQPVAVEIARLGGLKKRDKNYPLALGNASPEASLLASPTDVPSELPHGADKSSRIIDKTIKMLLQECKAIHERHKERPSEWYNEDEQQKIGLVEAVDLKGLTLTKHKVLLQAQGLGHAQYELVMSTPLSDFADRGVVYKLSSSFEKFPWVELFKRIITEIVVPTEMEPWQLEMAWEAMSEVKEVVRSVQIHRAILKGPFNSALMWSNCTFSPDTFDAMKGLFYVHHGITALDLRSSELGPEEAEALTPSLRIMTSLKTLHLEHNRLSPKGLASVQESFRFLTSLQMLTLRENGLGAYSGKMVVGSLKMCERLQFVDDVPIGILRGGGGRGKLDLTSKSIGPTEAGMLAELFIESGRLSALCLGNNQLGSEGGAAIAIGFLHLAYLQRLELDYNEIGEDGGVSIAEPMKQLTALVTLSLRKNDLMRRGGSVVCQTFEKMTNLENLDLASNYIEDQSVHNMAKYLSTLTKLRSLDLGNNKIGPNAFASLATCLTPLTMLEALILRENSIGPEGAEHLAEGIRHLTSLKVLDLGFSRVGRKGGLALAAKTRWMTALQKLKFEGNSMGQDAVSQIQTSVPEGCQLDIEAS
mmetsp:Transcript_28961/g.69542  ORF Transcript_28961/g.69542 Transcript_28961/m.69542 type:complete len:1427 (-) Transcript_28961:999-5279(-)